MPAGKARAPLSLRRPRRSLAVGAAIIALLGFLGSGVEARLTPTSLRIPGTSSDRGADLLEAHFGPSAPFAVLLRGPAPALDRQGPRLVRALRDEAGASVLSPWSGRRLPRLRPSPRRALVLADFRTTGRQAVREGVSRLDAILARETRPPVRATQTGYATLSRAIQQGSISATERAELIALPFLLIVLLLVFRTLPAALVPLVFGAAVVFSARGLLWIASHWLAIDAFSLTVATMMGLALGVDYTLLMVSRFREELARHGDRRRAATATRGSAGRTTLFAGTTLFVSMLVTVMLLPGSLLLSLAATAILVTGVSVLLANLLAPCLLVLLGPNLDRWRLGPRRSGESTLLLRALSAVTARPGPIAAVVGIVLLVLCAPALALRTGPPSVRQLPASDPARRDAELLSRQAGPGWEAPFVLVAASPRGPVAAAVNRRRLGRLQRLVAAQPGVEVVLGPAAALRRAAVLGRRGREALGQEGGRQLAGAQRLGDGLGTAARGVGRLRAGLSQASAGAGLLTTGSDRAGQGAAAIAGGLERVSGGGERAEDALERLSAGAARLDSAQGTARAGSLTLAVGLHDLLPQLRKGPLAQSRRLRAEIGAAAAGDPSLRAARSRSQALVMALAAMRNELRSLRRTAAKLDAGTVRLAAGQHRLAEGSDRLARAAGSLGSGLRQLSGGAEALHGGLSRLRGGSEALAAGLAEGYSRSAPLQGRLGAAATRVAGEADSAVRQREQLRRASPGLFASGYLATAALDGAPPGQRSLIAQAIDLDAGAGAARLVVVPADGLDTPGSEALDRRLGALAAGFERRTGMRVGVTGGPAELADYNRLTRSRVPLVVLAMALATFLALIVILRSLPLAAIAVALNLLTVGIAFGVLVALFHVPAGWPLGGHDYVDAIGAAAIFGIVFGLSVDYAVFLLARMREARTQGADHREAVAVGIRRTGGVIAGAAAIMIAVFLCFAAAPIATVSQLGIALAVAVALDATVVRLLLLPALMLLIGERVWWLPRPLERLLPDLEPQPA